MLDKKIGVPMIVGMALYGLSIVLSVLCSLNTQTVLKLFSTIEYEGNVFPASISRSVIILVLYIAFYCIMRTCNGKYNRVLGVIMLIAYCCPGFINFLWAFRDNVIAAQKGAEYLAVYSSVSSAISIVSTPFTIVASVLIVVALGRFGIISNESSEEKPSEENVYFGG